MARPGLEPGTPRFSVVRVVRPRMAESLAIMRFRPGHRAYQMFAVCGYLSPFVGMAGASGPNFDSRCAGKNRGPSLSLARTRWGAHSLFRGGGHELGGDADDCVSSLAGVWIGPSVMLAYTHAKRN